MSVVTGNLRLRVGLCCGRSPKKLGNWSARLRRRPGVNARSHAVAEPAQGAREPGGVSVAIIGSEWRIPLDRLGIRAKLSCHGRSAAPQKS